MSMIEQFREQRLILGFPVRFPWALRLSSPRVQSVQYLAQLVLERIFVRHRLLSDQLGKRQVLELLRESALSVLFGFLAFGFG